MHTVWTPKSGKISISPLYTIGKLLFKTEPLVVVVGDHGNVICITYGWCSCDIYSYNCYILWLGLHADRRNS